MRFSVLGSGSKGNAIYVESKKTAILIDAGFSGKEIAARLAAINRRIEDLDGIFISHEHSDHIRGAGVLARRCSLPLLANGKTFMAAEKSLGKISEFREFATGDCVGINDIEVRTFAISHDSVDPVAFVIEDATTSLGCCTDTGMVSRLMVQRLSKCNGLVLECNHDPNMLKSGPYPAALQQRVRSRHGHLSNEDGAGFLQSLIHNKLEEVVLAHLSETNNLPTLALEAVKKKIGHSKQFNICCAGQMEATRLFSLRGTNNL